MLSAENLGVITANEKGYYVDKDGSVWYNGKQRVLTPHNNGRQKPYYQFAIKLNNGKVKNVKVHKLQAYQKFGDKIFEKGICVRHLNDNSLDNSWDNIEIGTNSDNMMDIPKEKRIAHGRLAASYLIKFDADKVKNFYFECKSYKKTMEEFGIKSRSTLHNIIHNR